jgi:hypothetical protein
VATHSAAEGPDDESGDAARAPSGAALLEADVHPITAFGESAAAMSQRLGESESIACGVRSIGARPFRESLLRAQATVMLTADAFEAYPFVRPVRVEGVIGERDIPP